MAISLERPATHAQARPAAGADEAARSAFEEGRNAYDRADFPAALVHFKRAYALSARPQLLFNIGRAADSEGLTEEAIEAYATYLGALPNAENKAFVAGRLEKLRARSAEEASPKAPAPLPSASEEAGASLVLETRPAATALQIDGAPVALSGGPIGLRPGTHQVTVSAPGYAPETRQTSVRAGETATLSIVFARPAPPSERPAEKRRLVRNPWLWTAVGVVVAGAATGTAVALSRGGDSGGSFDRGTSDALGKSP